MTWDRVADVIVVGSGAAGFAAATTAAAAGSQVMLLERGSMLGGTTERSGGGYWIPNNRWMREAGIPDPKDWALKYMAKLAYPVQYRADHPTLGLTPNQFELIEVFYDTAADAVDHLDAIGALKSLHDPNQVDYNADLPEDKAPRGRYLNPAPLINNYFGHGNGQDLIEMCRRGADRLGVEMLLQHRVTGVSRDSAGEVDGVVVETPGGVQRFGARQGVVFASGGFIHNPEMRTDYLRGPIFGGCGVLTCTGDFVKIGIELGADLGNMSQAWWAQVVLGEVLDSPDPLKNVWMPGGDSSVLVNRYGKRVVNEKTTYNERGQIHHVWDAGKREYPNLLLFLIYDQATVDVTGFYFMRKPIPFPGEVPPWQLTGDTFEELEQRIRESLDNLSDRVAGFQLDDSFGENLKETIARYNRFAANGKDEDFGRGDTPIQTYWGAVPRPENTKNGTMFPFAEKGPYHCIIVAGGAIDTKGGPKTDGRARVLDLDGRPIARLYGAGNCVSSPAGQAYWSAGGTLGPCLAFGYIAGQQAAALSRREPAGIAAATT